ncbi:MAG: hypothetical protein ACREQ5_13950 [Candidatus Dormibacteria bacterium]
MATSTWCASAWLTVAAEIDVYSTNEAIERFSEERPSSGGEVVAGLWHLCRENVSYRSPETRPDAEQLRRLCRRTSKADHIPTVRVDGFYANLVTGRMGSAQREQVPTPAAGQRATL